MLFEVSNFNNEDSIKIINLLKDFDPSFEIKTDENHYRVHFVSYTRKNPDNTFEIVHYCFIFKNNDYDTFYLGSSLVNNSKDEENLLNKQLAFKNAISLFDTIERSYLWKEFNKIYLKKLSCIKISK